jgi:CheY-like chemotaxis protein
MAKDAYKSRRHCFHEERIMTTKHILLMDEKPIIYLSDFISELLEELEDTHVTAPDTLLEDVAEIEKLQPDLILMALRMDGTQQRVWTCVQHLKSHQVTKDIPIVLCGHHLIEMFAYLEREQGPILTLPGVEFHSQPFDADEFLSRLRQLLADPPSIS